MTESAASNQGIGEPETGGSVAVGVARISR
jgi:hypothetical protein